MSFAFVFPGQGSQSLKMMDGLLECPIVNEVFALANEVLAIDFLKMLQEELPHDINNTINTQPLLLTAGYATYKSWAYRHGKTPSVMAGHSLGEWTALVASDVIDFKDALQLVRLRAIAMQNAVSVEDGSMVAVLGLEDTKIIHICAQVANETGGIVSAVNFNFPGQVVIAGNKSSVELASARLKDNGAKKVQILQVSVPSHCKLMLKASEELERALDGIKFNQPKIKVIHNTNVEIYSDTELIKQVLVKQLYLPVLWSQTISQIVHMGINNIVECGPGRVLSGLNRRINENIVSYNLRTNEEFDIALSQLI